MSAYKDWFDQHGKMFTDKKAMYSAFCDEFNCSRDTAHHAYARHFKKPTSLVSAAPAESPSGLSALGDLFGKTNRIKRKTTKLHTAVDNIVKGELKKRAWMYDRDMQAAAGVSRDDWTYIRQDYEDLLLTATDDNSRRVTIWVHPDYKEKALELINS